MTLTPSAFLTPGALGSAIETTVANIASPTELNSLGTAQGEIRLARTTEAGTGTQTWYYLDTTSDAQNLPYIVTSATAGLKWIAFGGRYQNEAFSLLGAVVMASTLNVTGAVTLTVPLASTSGGTGINNAGTITNASNTTITGGGTLALGGFTLTVPATGTVGLLGVANTWTLANSFTATTSASSSTTGTVIVGNGTAATTVGIGGGNINAGGNLTTAGTANRITIGSVASVGTALQITKTQTATTGQDLGLNVVLTLANLSSKASQNTGIGGNITIDTSASSTTGACVGLLGSVDVNSTANTHAQPTGVQCIVRKGGANAITTAICLDTSFATSAAGTVGSVRGLYQSLSNSGGATITAAYGIYLEAITLGATNYAFFSAGAGLVSIGDTTDSTSITTGSVVTAGGIGVAKRLTLDGGTGKTIKYVNGTANAAVAVTFGAVGPTGSTAGNQVGWIRVDVGGTDRYIPYW